ncbi:MAG: YjbF family lipoprotein [Paracoccaceae bacterium]
MSARRLSIALACGLALAAVAGCGGQTDGSRGGGITKAVAARVLPKAPGVDTAEAQRLITGNAPRLAAYMVDRGGSVLMVKAGERAGVARWRSADNVQFYLRDGLIIGTRGLGFDLMTADTGGAAGLIRTARPGQITRVHRHLNGEGRIVIRSYVCDIEPAGTETVRIPDKPSVQALRVNEICHSPGGDFRNAYWLRDGRLVQTRQFIGDGVGRAQLIFLP